MGAPDDAAGNVLRVVLRNRGFQSSDFLFCNQFMKVKARFSPE